MNTENKYQKVLVDKFQRSAVCGFWRMDAKMEEMCGATGLYFDVIKRIIDGYKKEIGSDTPHSTTTGNSITCSSTENYLSCTV